ncbi:MAG: S8 family serine peptidase [Oscillospiraceae bacterium]|nr:S8 family serine peptidase [Oscillospiraceae bacterium]
MGHGTAVAGVAVREWKSKQSECKEELPVGADIIAVKLGRRGQESFARTTEIMRAIKYVIDKAQILKKPISINLSFGTNNGAHNGASLFETYIDEMSSKWKTVINVATR